MRFWGVWPPSKFYEASQEDRAFAIVAYQEEMKMLAYQQKVDKLKQEVDSLKANKSNDD